MPQMHNTDLASHLDTFPIFWAFFYLNNILYFWFHFEKQKKGEMRCWRDSLQHPIITVFDAGTSRLQSQMGRISLWSLTRGWSINQEYSSDTD